MINDDILIKYSRSRGHVPLWPQEVRWMRNRLYDIKIGFPGIGNDHMDLVELSQIKEGDYFIYDPYLENGPVGDIAPKMFHVLSGGNKWEISGIGIGLDLADPDRLRWRYKDIITSLPFDNISSTDLVLRVNVRPSLTGGPGYYYFLKSYRDFRL